MQKILRQWPDAATGKLCGEWCYPAKEVDDYMKSVKALVEATDDLIKLSEKNYGIITATLLGPVKRGKQAIAAVERLEG